MNMFPQETGDLANGIVWSNIEMHGNHCFTHGPKLVVPKQAGFEEFVIWYDAQQQTLSIGDIDFMQLAQHENFLDSQQRCIRFDRQWCILHDLLDAQSGHRLLRFIAVANEKVCDESHQCSLIGSLWIRVNFESIWNRSVGESVRLGTIVPFFE